METILIVEDEGDILLLLRQLLSSKWKVVAARNGREAVTMNEKEKPRMILMDIMMPVMDGISAIEIIRRDYDSARLPILVLSAIGDKKKFIEAFQAGANDYIPKPFNKTELLARVEVNLKAARLTGELEAKNHRLLEEKKLARRIQEGILPIQPRLHSLEIACFYRASDKIGGDFFDVRENERTVHIMIGDVSGHGTSSALLMAACKGILHTLGLSSDSPVDIVEKANAIMLEMVGNSGMFSTLIYLCLDKNTNEIEMVSAGHNPAYIIGKTEIHELPSTGLPLGFYPQSSWNTRRRTLRSDETVVLYTDGLIETRDATGRMFGADRLEDLWRRSAARKPAEIVDETVQKTDGFCQGRFQDDVTLLAFKRKD
ncbi:MAG: fused response regulator/phosphatase [Proteobacteria bacterium]|nr:fused response regulator/phosphatase [Pseudomonadota bacterium]